MKTSHQLGLKHCNRCGECCRASSCHLEQQDVSRIAAHLGLSRREFAREYLEVFEPRPGKVAVKPKMTPTGCVFLRGDDCGIQAVKPKGGADFKCWESQGGPQRYWWPSERLSRIGVVVQ